MVGDQTLPIKNAAGASLLQLQCAVEHRHEEGQCLMTTFLAICSELPFIDVEELQHALHIWRETLVLGMFTCSLLAQN